MGYCPECSQKHEKEDRFCRACSKSLYGGVETEAVLKERYEVRRRIKVGGMGVLYEVWDDLNEQRYALKEMIPAPFERVQAEIPADEYRKLEEDALGRFKREAKLLAKLSHAGLPKVLDYFSENGLYYLVMDLIEGEDLSQLLRREGKPGMPEAFVRDAALQILDILEYLHGQNPPVIYRDLKPSNVMLRSSDKRILLVDFGIAKAVQSSTMTATRLGTQGYEPVEQLMGKAEKRSDIFALGATLHCLLTGRNPGHGDVLRSLAPHVSAQLEAVVNRAREERLEDRFACVRAMREALAMERPKKGQSSPEKVPASPGPPAVQMQQPASSPAPELPPPVLPAAKAARGSLRIITDPQGALVFINGIRVGRTGADGLLIDQIVAGTCGLKVLMEGFEEHSEKLSIGAGANEKRIILKQRAATGLLSVHGEPEGAVIFLDDEYAGLMTPTGFESRSPLGLHKVVMQKAGYERHQSDVELGPEGTELEIRLKPVFLPSKPSPDKGTGAGAKADMWGDLDDAGEDYYALREDKVVSGTHDPAQDRSRKREVGPLASFFFWLISLALIALSVQFTIFSKLHGSYAYYESSTLELHNRLVRIYGDNPIFKSHSDFFSSFLLSLGVKPFTMCNRDWVEVLFWGILALSFGTIAGHYFEKCRSKVAMMIGIPLLGLLGAYSLAGEKSLAIFSNGPFMTIAVLALTAVGAVSSRSREKGTALAVYCGVVGAVFILVPAFHYISSGQLSNIIGGAAMPIVVIAIVCFEFPRWVFEYIWKDVPLPQPFIFLLIGTPSLMVLDYLLYPKSFWAGWFIFIVGVPAILLIFVIFWIGNEMRGRKMPDRRES